MNLRLDIQALRGWAVLLVVLHHARLLPLPAGFLGVDIFFVISGFLITGLIRDALAQGRWSLRQFYLRRAWRLLPAAYATFAATALAAVWLQEPAELRDFQAQLLGALGLVANVVLWRQAGYFDGAAELKPLLHIWSLSLEEQYYLLLPALLMLTPRRRWGLAVLALSLASWLLCHWGVRHQPSAAFYGLPTRAWELGVGSLAALVPAALRATQQAWLNRLRWPALAVLVGLPLWPLGGPHPGPDAWLITLATALLLLRQPPEAAATPLAAASSPDSTQRAWHPSPWRALVRLGDASYAVYLVHWPLFALLANATLGEPSTAWRLGALVASLGLGWALHRWVETPLRHGWPSRQATPRMDGPGLWWLVGAGVGCACLATWPARAPETQALLLALRQPTVGLSPSCDQDSAPYRDLPACRTAPAPRTWVWGDSFGMHLVPALAVSTPGGITQATRSTCAPFIDLAPLDDRDHPLAWAQACLAFNRSVLAALAQHPEVEVVVLSSPYMHLVAPHDLGRHWQVLDASASPPEVGPGSVQRASAGLLRTVAAVRALGKRVVIVAPPPWGEVDPWRCNARRLNRLLTLDTDGDCSLSEAASRQRQAPVLALLEEAEQHGVPVLSLAPWLCQAGRCATWQDGLGLYRDARHLSSAGSRTLGERWQLGQRLREMAR